MGVDDGLEGLYRMSSFRLLWQTISMRCPIIAEAAFTEFFMWLRKHRISTLFRNQLL